MQFWLKNVTVAAGSVSAILGLTVIVGWHTQTPILIQVHPLFVPMQYNTGVGFFLSGLGLLSVIYGFPRLATAIGAVVAALGILTLFQYVFAADLGIDQLMMKHYITVKTSSPGRMAPNTALSFSFAGFALLIRERLGEHRRSALLTGILGLLVLGLGFVSVSGYAMGIEIAYGWAEYTQMALHTSVGFVILGGGIFSFSGSRNWASESRDRETDSISGDHKRVLALIGVMMVVTVAVMGIVISMLYLSSFREQEKRLSETARSHARLIESVAKFDARFSRDFPGGSRAATLSQIKEGLSPLSRTIEVTIGRRVGNNISFLLRQKSSLRYEPAPIPFSSPMAEPMRRALSGKSGTLVGLDYRKVEVLAAHEPVDVLDLGIVFKIDIAEIREPFVHAAIVSGAIAIVIILIGVVIFQFISNPMIRKIQRSEARYRTLVHGQADLICRNLPDGTLLFVNDAYCRYFGKTADELVGTNFLQFVPEENHGYILDNIAFLSVNKPTRRHEHEVFTTSGEIRWLEWNNTAMFDEDGGVIEIVAVGRDTTERKMMETALNKSNRAFKTLSECNQALARVSNEEELLSEMCRIIVEHGNFRFAWIGFKEEDERKSVRPISHYGFEDGYLEALDIVWADTEKGLGSTGTAIRTGKPVVAKDILNDPKYRPWRAEAEKRGYKSSLALPLFLEGSVFGALNIYSDEIDYFDEDEVQLLEELANDISFGLRMLRQREQRRKAEEGLKSLGRVIDSSLNEVYVFDAETLKFIDVNLGARNNLGYSMDELSSLTPIDLKPEFTDDSFRALIEPLRSGAKKKLWFETVQRRRDGSDYPVEVSLQFIASETPPIFFANILDTTERKRNEAIVKQNEERFRGAIESLQEGFVLFDADDRIVMANKVYRHMNPKADEFLEKNMRFEDLLRTNVRRGQIIDAIGREEEFIRERLEQHRNPKGPILRQTDDGQWYIIKETRTPEGGTVVTFSDITDLMEAERVLKEREKYLRAVTETANDAIVIIDQEGRVILWNDAAEKIFGYAEFEILGKALIQIIPKRFRKRYREGLKRLNEAGVSTLLGGTTELVGLRKDGEEFPIDLSLSRWETQGKVNYVGNVRDITERKRAEAELNKLSSAVEQSPASVIITDIDGAIEYVNPKFTEINGYSPEDAIGQTPRLLKSGEMPDAVYKRLWADITAGKEWRGTLRNRRKDGTVYLAGVSISPIMAPDGTITHFISAAQDITQRVEIENRLKQADKMESIGGLAGGIAHDFNNMLLPILSLTDMTRKALPKDSRNRLRLEKVIEAATRAKDLVARILAFSRHEDAKRENIDIHAAIRETMALLGSTVPTTIKIKKRLKRDTGIVFSDRAQIVSVLLNLASNAVDAMDGQPGEMTVSLSPVKVSKKKAASISGLDEGKYAKLAVKDNGHGMDEKTLARVVDPFFTTKEVGKGTGLGLSMVYGIVSKHGGAVNISSTPGKGTTVEIYLPLVEDNAVDDTLDCDEAKGDIDAPGGNSAERSTAGGKQTRKH